MVNLCSIYTRNLVHHFKWHLQSRVPSRVPADRLVRISLQVFHVLRRQLEVENLRVFNDPRIGHGFGQGDISLNNQMMSIFSIIRLPQGGDSYLLQAPPDQDLGGSLAVLLCQALQAGFTHASSLDQRRVGLDDDVTLLQPPGDVLPRAPGVNLILPDGDLAADSAVDVCLQLFQVVDSIV